MNWNFLTPLKKKNSKLFKDSAAEWTLLRIPCNVQSNMLNDFFEVSKWGWLSTHIFTEVNQIPSFFYQMWKDIHVECPACKTQMWHAHYRKQWNNKSESMSLVAQHPCAPFIKQVLDLSLFLVGEKINLMTTLLPSIRPFTVLQGARHDRGSVLCTCEQNTDKNKCLAHQQISL